MASGYWKEVHAEAWRRTRETGFLEWKRLATSVVLPVVSGLIQWATGVSLALNLAVNIGGGLILYATLVFVERVVRTREVIAERDATQLRAIAKLTAATPTFRALIRELHIERASLDLGIVVVSAVFEVRYLGSEQGDTSIHSVQLRLCNLNIKAPVIVHVWPLTARVMERRFNFVFEHINAGDFIEARKQGLRWKFTFEDIHDKEYESETFTLIANR